jgi:two-component system sensor histidine kinase/response regulator
MTDQATEIYDLSPIGVCILRHDRNDMTILYVNDAFKHMLAAPHQNFIGVNPLEMWGNDSLQGLIKGLQSPTPPASYNLQFTNAERKTDRWAKCTIQHTQYKGQDAHVIWATDISENKESEDKLIEAIAQADAMANMKSNFLATMSHEIRTPMQSVYGLLELIGEENPDARVMNMAKTAQNAASGLLEILDDILDIAKIDADKMELDLFEVPVRTLVRGILEALSVNVHGHHVALIDEIEEAVPPVIIGDPKRLRQIIMNLTGNAIKFTKDGKVTVHVTNNIQHLAKPTHGTALRFEIRDTGMGMDEATRARLFVPFSQADSSTSRKFGGTGLGLSISKRLVDLMGGIIGVESEPGVGSVFWFEIPTEIVDAQKSSLNLPQLDGISVLSVEDHPQGAREIMRSLESMGASVESCPTYAEALELIKRRPFDVAVIDQGLPDGLGIDLIREIMDMNPYMGLIMYTVRDDLGLQHTLNALGVTYLSKPASRLGLGTAVKDAAKHVIKPIRAEARKILIAEDTASVRDVLKRQLNKIGLEADFVTNGQEALDAWMTGAYGILFTDLHMPEMDGYQLSHIIRDKEEKRISPYGENDQHFPIIVLTADVQMAQRQTYLKHGFDECMLKPVSLRQFKRLLIRWGLIDVSLDEDHLEKEALPSPNTTKPLSALDVVEHDQMIADYGSNSNDITEASDQSTKENTLANSKTDLNEPSKLPALNREAIIEYMGAIDENTVQMMHLFVEMTQPLLDELENARQHNDYIAMSQIAHSLKGASRSAGCLILGEICAKLQDDAASLSPQSGLLVDKIYAEFQRVKIEVLELVPDP